jgi:hypothetical protein
LIPGFARELLFTAWAIFIIPGQENELNDSLTSTLPSRKNRNHMPSPQLGLRCSESKCIWLSKSGPSSTPDVSRNRKLTHYREVCDAGFQVRWRRATYQCRDG